MHISPKPANSKWTDDQWRAISAEGNNLLVAAAAGSGKTAVLVERIIRKITDEENPADLDRLLIVTFTNAAAQEMRHRIGEALEDKISEQPRSLHLRRQLNLLHKAQISTLHSFCMSIVRDFYYVTDIDPSFRILDETEGVLLRDEVLEELFEEAYSDENPDDFYDMVERFSNDRSDEGLKQVLLAVYHFSLSHPNPFEWLQYAASLYDKAGSGDVFELPWFDELTGIVKENLSESVSFLSEALQLIDSHEGFEPYRDAVAFELDQARNILESDHPGTAIDRLSSVTFPRLKPLSKKVAFDPEIQEKIKQLRDKAKKTVDDSRSAYALNSLDDALNDLGALAEPVRELAKTIQQFEKKYAIKKREKGVVDFSDLEHFALKILTSSLKGEPIANQYSNYFQEVMTDEYQDTNRVQEAILSQVSGSSNRFMVGDIKQSIYRFRLAEPAIFLDKYRRYTSDGSGEGMVIDLSMNFRSRDEILSAVNYVFRQTMDERVGEIHYDDAASLVTGNHLFPEVFSPLVHVQLVDVTESESETDSHKSPDYDSDEKEQDLSAAQAEARSMIASIKSMTESSSVFDPSTGHERPVSYRDIVILVRSMTWADTFMEEFKAAGIPMYADLSNGYFTAIEVQIMIALLKIIDNPVQDVPLASVLRSPIVGLSADEMAEIRIDRPSSDFFSAIHHYADRDQVENESLQIKVSAFLTKLNEWRSAARSTALSSLIWKLYRETGYYDYAGGMPGGKQRQANLKALYDRAKAYEKTSFRGLYRFLSFIAKMQERGDDLGEARAIGEQEDVVRLITIHKSKGLEFPIVFIPGINREFNQMDLRKSYLMHQKHGLGTQWFDPELRVLYPSVQHELMKEISRREMLAEEMRVLYVAMTRAKEQLHLIGSGKNLPDQLEKWLNAGDEEGPVIPVPQRLRSKRYADWIIPAIGRHPDIQQCLRDADIPVPSTIFDDRSKWSMTLTQSTDLPQYVGDLQPEQHTIIDQLAKGAPVKSDPTFDLEVKERFEWSYAHKEATQYLAKQTVSELKQTLDSDYGSDDFVRHFTPDFAERPAFMQQKKLKPAEKGTLVHLVMQLVNLKQISNKEIQAQLKQWVLEDRLTQEEANQLPVEQIARFFQTETGAEMREAKQVWRELPFSFETPVKMAYPDWQGPSDEQVFIQGMVDALYQSHDGELVLVDYKTDRIPEHLQDDSAIGAYFKNRYQTQIALYTAAIENSWKHKIDKACLYLVENGMIVTIDQEVSE